MKSLVKQKPRLKQYRFPTSTILLAVKLYSTTTLTYREVALKLNAKGISVSHKTVFEWTQKFKIDNKGQLVSILNKKRA